MLNLCTQWNIWITALIRDEILNCIKAAHQCCYVKRSAVPFVLVVTHEFIDGRYLSLSEVASSKRDEEWGCRLYPIKTLYTA